MLRRTDDADGLQYAVVGRERQRERGCQAGVESGDPIVQAILRGGTRVEFEAVAARAACRGRVDRRQDCGADHPGLAVGEGACANGRGKVEGRVQGRDRAHPRGGWHRGWRRHPSTPAGNRVVATARRFQRLLVVTTALRAREDIGSLRGARLCQRHVAGGGGGAARMYSYGRAAGARRAAVDGEQRQSRQNTPMRRGLRAGRARGALAAADHRRETPGGPQPTRRGGERWSAS